MKKIISLLLLFLKCVVHNANAQGVGINPSGSSPNSAAGLDVNFTDKGMLIPRLTTPQRNSITSPPQSLLIYNTTSRCFETYEVGLWQTIWCSCNPPAAAGTISGLTTVCQGQNNVAYSVGSIANATGYVWTLPSGATIATGPNTNSITVNYSTSASSGNITGYGTSASCGNGASANYAVTVNPLPDVAGSINGSATVCQGQNGISYSVAAITNATSYTWSYSGSGATISGSTNPMTINFSAGATSGNLTVTGTNACGSGTVSTSYAITVNSPPAAATAGTHVSSQTQIVWNWNTVSGATGYKWSTTNNYSGATDNAAVTSYTQAGLTCNTPYTLYVWAYNVCGNSTVTTLTKTTSACPFTCGSSTVTFIYRGSSVTYGTVSNNSRCWLDRNLGASQVAAAFNDNTAYGDLVQWGRLDDGHQSRTSTTTATRSTTDVPGHSNFIAGFSDWRTTTNNALWQGVSGTNNPCPSGWRIPTETEWTTEKNSWSSQNSSGAYASPLKLTAAGYRLYDASLYRVNTDGYYASSTVSPPYARYLDFTSSIAGFDTNDRAVGSSVRCILN